MRLFLDSANLDEIRTWLARRAIRGVTTNPILAKQAHTDRSTIQEIVRFSAPYPVSVQVHSRVANEMTNEAKSLFDLGSNTVVKIPVVGPDGSPNLEPIHAVSVLGIPVNATACMTVGQALLAAYAGARYVSLLAGRIEEEGGSSVNVAHLTRTALTQAGLEAEIIVGSVREPGLVARLIPTGADICTLSADILGKLADHRYSRATAEQFYRAAETHSQSA
ncbi:transaldolase family protein [Streptomyces sp. NPDC020747]|uniref:transaldolase family protein n=1 Tax=Streptomyces sp. NPDC020747 TaxID=3365086 RepID=UPI00379D0399